jgi:hypothetical protein
MLQLKVRRKNVFILPERDAWMVGVFLPKTVAEQTSF